MLRGAAAPAAMTVRAEQQRIDVELVQVRGGLGVQLEFESGGVCAQSRDADGDLIGASDYELECDDSGQHAARCADPRRQ
jgi:hypothetical protein